MTTNPRPPKRHTRNRSMVVSDFGAIFERPQVNEVFSSEDSKAMHGGGGRNACSPPTKSTNARTGAEEHEVESLGRVWTEAEEICSIIDPPTGLVQIKGKTLIRDEDAPPGFGFIAKPRSSLTIFKSCSSTQFQVILNEKTFDEPLPSPVLEVYGSSVDASRLAFPNRTSKFKASSVCAGLGLIVREEELLSPTSFNKHLEDADESDDDGASICDVESDTLALGVDPSNITGSHGVGSNKCLDE